MKRYTNKELSKDIDSTIEYFLNNGYTMTSDVENTVRNLIPFHFLIKYITTEDLVRNGGLLKYCDNNKGYFGLISGKVSYSVQYVNIKYLFYKKCKDKGTEKHSLSDIFHSKVAKVDLPSEVKKEIAIEYSREPMSVILDRVQHPPKKKEFFDWEKVME